MLSADLTRMIHILDTEHPWDVHSVNSEHSEAITCLEWDQSGEDRSGAGGPAWLRGTVTLILDLNLRATCSLFLVTSPESTAGTGGSPCGFVATALHVLHVHTHFRSAPGATPPPHQACASPALDILPVAAPAHSEGLQCRFAPHRLPAPVS